MKPEAPTPTVPRDEWKWVWERWISGGWKSQLILSAIAPWSLKRVSAFKVPFPVPDHCFHYSIVGLLDSLNVIEQAFPCDAVYVNPIAEIKGVGCSAKPIKASYSFTGHVFVRCDHAGDWMDYVRRERKGGSGIMWHIKKFPRRPRYSLTTWLRRMWEWEWLGLASSGPRFESRG